ncbi:helix-turn-helix transcriptional regulator [Dactylosporangium matsuzakiense]|uniref:helix-turn-helix transcriptional regulator n=1 Tax=Dactylosporangium matsuzakiense TaxID=53360 RepID=UPI0021C26992|nr:helix-turn-helix transcriptional regulator [Dactylosporangium matsuzakiense]UWZ47951.1 LuxR family transcriptional regulator [Dactylosporangium matsuzakiense]
MPDQHLRRLEPAPPVAARRRGRRRLIVEDLHWADRSTRDLVAFLIQTVREVGVLLLITYRSDELHRRHPLRPLLATWERNRGVDRIDVERFGRAEVAAQVEAIAGGPSAARLTDVVYERSHGNAFLVEEILAAVAGGADPGDLPPSLRDVLLARTEAVSGPAQEILRAAAVAGPRVTERLLQIVAAVPETALHPALREAVEHHLLVVDASGRGYTFRHELTRDALYDDLLPGERVRLHGAYGHAIAADQGLLADDGSVAGVLAHHWYAALDLPRALAASVAAGTQDAAGLTPAEALRHLERALQIWPRVPLPASVAGLAWSEVGLCAVEAAVGAGELQRALSLMDEVMSAAGAGADPVEHARLVHRRSAVLRWLGRDEEATRQLRDALTVLPAAPVTSTHAELLAALANSLARSGEDGECEVVARRAVAAATAVGATAARADALVSLSVTCYLGDPGTGLAALREGLALATANGLHRVALRGHINLSDCLELLGRHAEAAEVAAAGMALATRLGHGRSQGAMLAGNVAEPLIHLGRWREALDLITESLAEDPRGVFASTLLILRGELHLWQGDTSPARHDVAEARRQLGGGDDVQYSLPIAYIEAELDRIAGAFAAARDRVRAALDRPIAGTAVRYAWPLLWLGLRIEADDPAGAAPAAATAALRDLAATLGCGTAPAAAYRALAEAEVARRDGRSEVAAWRAAGDAARRADEAYLLSYALFRLAEAQTAAGDPAAAAATAQEGLRLADELATTVAEDIRTLIRRARLRTDAERPGPAGPQRRFRLTDREHEVLVLLAEGRSNAQIAAALYISPKTASVHVSNILAKIGAANRTEAAGTAHRLGLLAAS